MGERRTCPTCGESYPQEVIFCPRDGAPLGGRKTELQDDAYLGLELAGQFRLEQLVGIGAMGRVYRAHQAGIGRDVAVKILHRELLTNDTLIRRFHQEAKVASRLLHPNVVQVLMTGQLPRAPGSLIGGEAYLAMEYLDGISLRSALGAAGGAMPLPRALHVLLQVCDAVGEAHAQNIVHRDLKPENVMLVHRGDDRDFVKVLDFGVAKIDLGEESVATQAGAVFGTARYVSPEGARGERVGPPSDVYALATMLFQTLSGETPFDGENPVAILVKHANADPPDVRSVARSSYVPEPIALAIATNLSKQAGKRCADARAFGRLLIDAARQSGLSPEDLALRSTLLGGNGAVNLSSLQRTKSLGLTPELAAQMRGDPSGAEQPSAARHVGPGGTAYVEGAGPPGGTQLVDPQDASPAPASDSEAARTSAAAPTQGAELDEVVAPPGPASDETGPSSSAALTHTADSEARLSSPRHSHPLATEADRDSLGSPSVPPGSASPLDLNSPGKDPPSRALLLVLCFVLGAALSVGLAYRMGVFNRKALSAERYAAQARTAMEAGNWDSPPGNNVLEITDAALQHWPRHPQLIHVRRASAERLAAQAETNLAHPAEAKRLLRLASELDPDNAKAKLLLGSLVRASEPIAVPSAAEPSEQPAGVPPRPTRSPSNSVRPPGSGAAPSAAPSATPSPSAPVPTPPAPSAGGRWL